MAPSPPRYSELKEEEEEEEEDALSNQSCAYEGESIGGPRREWTKTRWIIILFTSLISTNTLTGIMATKVALDSHHHKAAAFLPPYGVPTFFRNISLDLHSQEIYAPLYDRSHSLYRKHDSPETEVAWRELTQLGSNP